MASGNDPANIPYIIVENGFYYVAYKEKVKVPEVVVSAKGVANGLSEEYNDGWDFGPDSYNPNSTANTPYTQSMGVIEVINYAVSLNGNVVIKFKPGVYLISAPFQEVAAANGFPSTNIYAQIMLPVVNLPDTLSLVFEGSDMPNWWEGDQASTNNLPLESSVILYSTLSTTSTNSDHFIMAVPPGNNSGTLNINQVFLTLNGIMFQADNDANIGGLEAWYASAVYGSFFGMSIPYYLGQTSVPSTAYGIMLPIDSNTSTVHIGTIFISGMYSGLIMSGGHFHIDKLVVAQCIRGITLFGSDNYNNFIGMYDLQVAQYGIVCSGGTNFHLTFGLWTWGDQPTTGTFTFEGWINDYGGSSALTINGYVNTANPSVVPYGQSSVTGSGSYVNLIPAGRSLATPTLSANPPVSGTVYRNLNTYDIEIDLPVYATTAGTAGYVTVAKGGSDTPASIGNQYVSGSTSSTSVDIIRLRVPAGWYYEFTASGVTFGTASVFAE